MSINLGRPSIGLEKILIAHFNVLTIANATDKVVIKLISLRSFCHSLQCNLFLLHRMLFDCVVIPSFFYSSLCALFGSIYWFLIASSLLMHFLGEFWPLILSSSHKIPIRKIDCNELRTHPGLRHKIIRRWVSVFSNILDFIFHNVISANTHKNAENALTNNERPTNSNRKTLYFFLPSAQPMCVCVCVCAKIIIMLRKI